MRRTVIAGNWKMNLTGAEALELVEAIHSNYSPVGNIDVIVAPPFLSLPAVVHYLKSSYIGVAAQNIHYEDKGAFTGECSAAQVRDAGAEYTIIGHSERRQYFLETDELVSKKISAAFNHNVTPIVCIGETLEQRESGEFSTIIENQLSGGLIQVVPPKAAQLIIAYEPVWAIGTGKTASPQQVEEVHQMIRAFLGNRFGQEVSESIPILYGGSVKPSNSKELLSLTNVDGALVGGASLKPSDFIAIIQSVWIRTTDYCFKKSSNRMICSINSFIVY